MLAIADAAGGLHVFNAVMILGVGGVRCYRAWRIDRAEEARPVAAPRQPEARV